MQRVRRNRIATKLLNRFDPGGFAHRAAVRHPTLHVRKSCRALACPSKVSRRRFLQALSLEPADRRWSKRPLDPGWWPSDHGRSNRPADNGGNSRTPEDIHAGISPPDLIGPARWLLLPRAALPGGDLAARTATSIHHPARRGAPRRRLIRHTRAGPGVLVHVRTAAHDAGNGNDRQSTLTRSAGFSVRTE